MKHVPASAAANTVDLFFTMDVAIQVEQRISRPRVLLSSSDVRPVRELSMSIADSGEAVTRPI